MPKWIIEDPLALGEHVTDGRYFHLEEADPERPGFAAEPPKFMWVDDVAKAHRWSLKREAQFYLDSIWGVDAGSHGLHVVKVER